MKKIVPNRVMRMANGSEYDAPDEPTYLNAVQNADRTWTIQVPDDQQPT